MSSVNTSGTNAEADAINAGSIIFIRFWSIVMFCFGIVGHSLSFYVFTRPLLRSNPCSRYFLASALSGFVVAGFSVPLRFIQNGYGINVFGQSLASCKILTFILFWARAQTSWFIVLASADRFLCSSSSATIRAWSNLRVAAWAIPLGTLLVGLAYVHVLIYYQINIRQQSCIAEQGIYAIVLGICHLIVFSLGPPIGMLLFGLLTVRHIRQTMRRTVPQNTQTLAGTQPQPQPEQRRKAKDGQLMQMTFVQCAVFSVTAIPIAINYLYTSLKPSVVGDPLQTAKDNLFYSTVGLISYIGPCMSFYLYTLSSQLFRRELAHLFNNICRANHVTVVDTINLTQRV